EQRREHAHERRLAGAVLAEDGDALAAGDGEADVAQRGHAPAPHLPAHAAAVAADELLAQVADFDGRCGGHAAPSEGRWIAPRARAPVGAWGGALAFVGARPVPGT